MRILLVVLLLFNGLHFWSAIDPFYKEVLQRDYELIKGDSVRFPDGSSCKISDFNDGICGLEWMTTDYCIPEGRYVWDGTCCEGLTPFLEENTDGQEVCSPSEESFFTSKSFTYFFIGVLIPLSLFVFLAYKAKKGLPKKEN